ncbi:hypothetical protein GCM10010218_51320 [Streptomyces mashuensis]|uniref:Uncharacterized protein n=1 Tax=Streptomyces mashuensis TaxID=33904 RepID=A0A919B8P3_9ACTN|nr:hypothetical protein GCM10010218_51320 [Streptomyces mashuensis]
MVSDGKACDDRATDHMDSGETRRFLSRLSGALGATGVLLVQKVDPGPEGADLVPGSGLRWPKCECGSPKCPDYDPTAGRPGEELRARVAEANRWSRRSGL